MIRSRLEHLARAQKRPRLDDFSMNQTSSSHQSNFENNENQDNVSSESDNVDSDSEAQLIYFEVGMKRRKNCAFGMQAFVTPVNVEIVSVVPIVIAKPVLFT
uniref:Uncharacterized protein n=1 Tax=Meloidogyne floridensis TaxID=298350 RepID=A0A915NJQ9_9BILA